MSKRFYQILSISMLLLIIGMGSSMATTNPVVFNNWKSGNAAFECAQAGSAVHTSYACAYKINDNTSGNPTVHVTCTGPDGQDWSTTIAISNSDGYVFDWASNPMAISAVIVKAGRGANVWYYNPAATGDTELYAYENKEISHVTFCWNGQEPPQPPQSILEVSKFYDANANGIWDSGEPEIEGWQVYINDMCTYTPVSISVSPGTYTISERLPYEPNWVPTTDEEIIVGITEGETENVIFGNVCLGPGGGRTLGFWSNKNGQSVMNDGGSMASELLMLRNLCLRDGSGNHFDPILYNSFRSWILGANATNMAYMLSAQLAAMALNVEAGFVSGNSLVYAPALLPYAPITGLNELGFISITDLMNAANAELCEHGTAYSGDTWRAYQEALKNVLDAANNNYNFVQPTPCPFTFPECQ